MLAGYPPFYDETHVGTYERILAGKVRCPRHFDSAAKELVKGLLVVDRTRRLGNLKGGADDIKNHRFFKGIDWRGLLRRTVRVWFSIFPVQKRLFLSNQQNWQAPLVPVHKHEYDTSNFEKYPDEKPKEQPEGDPYRHLFPDFWIFSFSVSSSHLPPLYHSSLPPRPSSLRYSRCFFFLPSYLRSSL